ncbi:MAG: hypothetical protein R2822_11810 [Spirosomataceae bacterium]
MPETAKGGLYKCRVTYSEVIEKIEFESYEPRVVQSLCLITDNTIQYDFKYHNRQQLNALFSQRGEADDVLIVQNDLITDTSYANIVFWEGSQWHTPVVICLLVHNALDCWKKKK